MTSLFPTVTNLCRRVYRILATDVKTIWQVLEESEKPTEKGFFDGYIYHPPI